MIPEKIRKLVFTDSFIQEWEANLPFFPTGKDAFEHLETIHESEFGRRRFSDYESFRNLKSYHFKKRKKAKVFTPKKS